MTQYTRNDITKNSNSIYNSKKFFDFSTIPIGNFAEENSEAKGVIDPVYFATPWSDPKNSTLILENKDNVA